MTVSALPLVEPAFCSAPAFTRTLGPEVADLAALAGFAPDPEQRLGLDLIFALDGGRSAAFEFAVVCGRQNLKTGLFKQAALGWLFVTDQQLVVWSAHEFSTAQEAFRDMAGLVEGCDYLSRRVRRIYRGNGEECIELLGGQRVKFKARTKTGGRGLSGDKVVLDEAFALQDVHMGALMPTLSVRPDPQLMYGSSAGLGYSRVLRSVRDRGRSGSASRLAYLEWCAPVGCASAACSHRVGTPGCAMDDVENWRRANPLLGRTRGNGTGLTLEYVRAERAALSPEEFGRERLGWWDAPDGVGADEPEFVAWRSVWRAALDATPGLDLGAVAFGVTVCPDRSSAWVGVAGRRADGRVQVEVAATGRGVAWVVDWLERRSARWSPVAVVLDGTAAVLHVPLEARGVAVVGTSSRDRAQATAGFYDDVAADRVRHPGEPSLDAAVARAVKRPMGDAWVWDGPGVGPLVAVTLARHGLVGERPREPAPAPRLLSTGTETSELTRAGF